MIGLYNYNIINLDNKGKESYSLEGDATFALPRCIIRILRCVTVYCFLSSLQMNSSNGHT